MTTEKIHFDVLRVPATTTLRELRTISEEIGMPYTELVDWHIYWVKGLRFSEYYMPNLKRIREEKE